jgi:hypothetical protein
MNATISLNPLIYRPDYEKIQDDEGDTIQELVETLQEISDITSKDYGRAVRSVHAKPHGLIRGKLTIKKDLPDFLKQGIFASEGIYPAIMRFSTSPGDIMHDSVSTPRGIAIKLMGVEGERLTGEPTSRTQDFLMVNGPAFLKPDAKSFVPGLKLLAKTTDRAEGLKRVFSAVLRGTERLIERLGGESPTIKSLGGHPQTNILGETFFTQVPLLYGKYMAKFSLVPIAPELTALKDAPLEADKENGIREAVSAFFKTHTAKWELRAQLCTNIETMPIEDASVVWPEVESPYIAVATLEATPQVSWDDATFPQIEDRLTFSPWNGVQDHRPLGSVMRARRHVYQSSSNFRKQFNGCPMAEINALEEV